MSDAAVTPESRHARKERTRRAILDAALARIEGEVRRFRGRAERPTLTDVLATFVMPFVFVVLMFMSVMTGATHLLNAVVEEKMSKISEVLVGSIEPFKLLLGKLLGVTGDARLAIDTHAGDLVAQDPVGEGDVQLWPSTNEAGSGIVAADDAAEWAGVTDLQLPFP